MKKYTFYVGTEDNSFAKVRKEFSSVFDNFTITQGYGVWTDNGLIVEIKSYIIEVIVSKEDFINNRIPSLKKLLEKS